MTGEVGTLNMMDLIRNLHDKPEGQSMSDVTFVLDDQTELQAHKLILAAASPYFEALFYGPVRRSLLCKQKIEVKDVEADVFRIIIQTIYNSGRVDFEVNGLGQNDKFGAMMIAADMYLLQDLCDSLAVELAEELDRCTEHENWKYLLPHLDHVSQLPLFSKVYKDIKKDIIEHLPEVSSGRSLGETLPKSSS